MRNFFNKFIKRFSIVYLYFVIFYAYGLLLVETTPVNAYNREEVYPCGEIVGLYVESDGIFVIEASEIETQAGEFISPAKDVLQTGDYITKVNGLPVFIKEDLVDAVVASNGNVINLTVKREQEIFEVKITPILAKNGTYKLGVWVKDDLAGVGTITYVTKEGEFGALGHGMNDGETDDILDIREGAVYVSNLIGINKGKKGEPGEVRGVLCYGESNHLGLLNTNISTGVYGKIDEDNMTDYVSEVEAYQVAYMQEIKVGDAQIISDVSGERKSYDVEITYVDYLAFNTNKGLHIKVTDPELLDLTGGIVQGMSGSPILQNGRIVGAVTHVLVNDPTKGYGIFIENMLEH